MSTRTLALPGPYFFGACTNSQSAPELVSAETSQLSALPSPMPGSPRTLSNIAFAPLPAPPEIKKRRKPFPGFGEPRKRLITVLPENSDCIEDGKLMSSKSGIISTQRSLRAKTKPVESHHHHHHHHYHPHRSSRTSQAHSQSHSHRSASSSSSSRQRHLLSKSHPRASNDPDGFEIEADLKALAKHVRSAWKKWTGGTKITGKRKGQECEHLTAEVNPYRSTASDGPTTHEREAVKKL